MGQIEKFEDLIAWQKARTLTAAVYSATRGRDRALVDQLRRAAVSVMSNVAEGYERASDREFHHFLLIAKASCAEVRSHLYVALDAGYLSSEQFHSLLGQAQETGRVIGGLRGSVERCLQS